jgi:hypothetical protein
MRRHWRDDKEGGRDRAESPQSILSEAKLALNSGDIDMALALSEAASAGDRAHPIEAPAKYGGG